MQIPGTARHTAEIISPRSSAWLAVLVLLAQLPHYMHLPWWVSVFGAAVVSGRILATSGRESRVGNLALSAPVLAIAALLAAVAVRLHYGYFLGRDPCVAFLFLLVSFKFAESRHQKDATLLVGLSGFLLLTQYFYSQTILSAVVTLPAVLALGGALLVLREQSNSLSIRASMLLTGKLLLQGAPIAAALFLLFPRLPGPLWNLPNDATGTTGLSDKMAPGTISALSLSGKVAFRVDFDDRIPLPEQRYWRGPVLSVFDGREWSVDRRSRPQTPTPASPSDLKDGSEINYTVTLEPHRRRWLFALDVPSSLPSSVVADGSTPKVLARMNSDLQLLSTSVVRNAFRYRQSSTLNSTYIENDAPLIAATQIAGRNLRAERFAQDLRHQYPDDRAYISALLAWFNQEKFFYTLQPSVLGDRPVDEFLFDSRRGFCEHYASAFVFLLRSASIPARVVTGYLGGEMNGDYMIVRQSDAHAWAEAWINGAWHRFDPTAAVAPSRVETGLASALPDDEPVPALARIDNGWVKKLSLGWDAINHDWRRLIVDFNNESQHRLWQSLGFPTPAAWQITTLIIAVAALWCWFALGLKVTRRQRLSIEDKLWMDYCKRLQTAGLPRAPNEGPKDYCQRTTARWPALKNSFADITRHFIELRYANPDPTKRLSVLAEAKLAINRLPSSRKLRRLATQ